MNVDLNGVSNGYIVERPKKRVLVKLLDGTTTIIDAAGCVTINDLKIKIQNDMSFDVDEQKLFLFGRHLNDDETLDGLDVEDELTMNLLIRLKGGVQIFAKMMDGTMATFEVLPTETIADVKMKIEEKFGTSAEEMKLVHQGQHLMNDNDTIECCCISDGSVINVECPSRVILAKTMDGKTFELWVWSTETIADVKRQIQEKIGLCPDEQKLIFQGCILEDDRPVDHYQIADQSVINVMVRNRGGLQIFAKTMDGKTVTIEVMKYDTIAEIKKQIQDKIGLSPDEQILVFQGGILKDDKTVDHYQIDPRKSTIAVMRKSRVILAKTMDGKTFELWVWTTDTIAGVKSMDRKTVTIEVMKNETIADIKKKIQDKIGLHLDEQKLVFEGHMLEDNKAVDHYPITDQSVINVVQRLRCGMLIFAKTMDGKTFKLWVWTTDTIADVKRIIQKESGLRPDEHKLVFQGGILEDDKTVDHYQIADQSVINVVKRLRNSSWYRLV